LSGSGPAKKINRRASILSRKHDCIITSFLSHTPFLIIKIFDFDQHYCPFIQTHTMMNRFSTTLMAFAPFLVVVARGQVLELINNNINSNSNNNINSNNNNNEIVGNLIPEWLPQCFNNDDMDSFDPFSVVGCVEDNTLPSCLVGTNLQDIISEVAQCISNSIEDEVAALMEQQQENDNGSSSSSSSGSSTATSRQGGNTLGGILDDIFGNFMGEGGGDDGEGDDQGGEGDELLNIGRAFVNATRVCLDPFADCVEETIQQAVSELSPCINITLTELVQCGRDNSDVCLESCKGTGLVGMNTNPFGDLVLTQVDTCPQIQTNIMDPLCDMVGCCEPCVPKVEALMDCLVNQELDQVPTTGDSCELTCPSTRRRLDGKDSRVPSRKLTVASTTASEECLQFAPGLTGDDSKELLARSAVFLPCAYESFRQAIDEPQVVSSATTAAAAAAGDEGTSEVTGVETNDNEGTSNVDESTNEGTSEVNESANGASSEVNEVSSGGRSAFGNMAMGAVVSTLAVFF